MQCFTADLSTLALLQYNSLTNSKCPALAGIFAPELVEKLFITPIRERN